MISLSERVRKLKKENVDSSRGLRRWKEKLRRVRIPADYACTSISDFLNHKDLIETGSTVLFSPLNYSIECDPQPLPLGIAYEVTLSDGICRLSTYVSGTASNPHGTLLSRMMNEGLPFDNIILQNGRMWPVGIESLGGLDPRLYIVGLGTRESLQRTRATYGLANLLPEMPQISFEPA